MSYPKKTQRFEVFIKELLAARNPISRQDAVDLMQQVMKAVEDHYGLPNDYVVSQRRVACQGGCLPRCMVDAP